MASRSAIAALAALMMATAVNAVGQTNPPSSQAARAGSNRATPIRIQTQTQFVLHGSGSGTLEDQRLLQENLRRAIYETAAKECEILNAVFPWRVSSRVSQRQQQCARPRHQQRPRERQWRRDVRNLSAIGLMTFPVQTF